MVVRQFAVLGTPSFTTWVSCQATIVSDSTFWSFEPDPASVLDPE